jgi:hypothetical protein
MSKKDFLSASTTVFLLFHNLGDEVYNHGTSGEDDEGL